MTGTPGGTRPCSSTLARMSSAAPWAGRPVAIVHDWFQGYHGAERVVEVIADDVLAEASRVDVFTFHAERDLLPPRLAARIVRESRPSRLPGLAPGRARPGALAIPPPLHAPLLPLARPQRVRPRRRLLALLRDQRLAAAGHALRLLLPHADALRLARRHRARAARRRPGPGSGRRSRAGCASRTARAAQRPDQHSLPSRPLFRNASARFYGRESTVIHPPVDVEDFASPPRRQRAGPLSMGASSRALQASAARGRGLPRPPVPTDDGRDRPARMSQLRAMLPPNVELTSWRFSRGRSSPISMPRAALASSTSVRRTSGSRWSKCLHRALRSLRSTAEVRGISSATAVDGVLLDEPSVDALREAVERVAGDRVGPAGARRARRRVLAARASSPRCGSCLS